MAKDEFKMEIVKDYGFITEKPGKYQIAVRAVKWGDDNNVKLDIRNVDTETGKIFKGISLSISSVETLYNEGILESFLNDIENEFEPLVE